MLNVLYRYKAGGSASLRDISLSVLKQYYYIIVSELPIVNRQFYLCMYLFIFLGQSKFQCYILGYNKPIILQYLNVY